MRIARRDRPTALCISSVLFFLVALTSPQTPATATTRDGPHFRLTPARGPVGTVVHYRGKLPKDQIRLNGAQPDLTLTGGAYTPSCGAYYANVRSLSTRIDRQTGQVSGSFRIEPKGGCRPSGKTHTPQPGAYTFAYGCVACTVATFHITAAGSRPSLRLHPNSGPAGTLVHLTGRIPAGREGHALRQDLTAPYFPHGMSRDDATCEYAIGANHLHIDIRGNRVAGSFTVGRDTTAPCDQSNRRTSVTPGRYRLFVGCLSCDVASFELTPRGSTLAFTGTAVQAPLCLAALLIILGLCCLIAAHHRKPTKSA
jgi:hypothetical protein